MIQCDHYDIIPEMIQFVELDSKSKFLIADKIYRYSKKISFLEVHNFFLFIVYLYSLLFIIS